MNDYEKNVALMARRLSTISGSVCVPVNTNDGLYIAQPVGKKSLPEKMDLVRVSIVLEQEERVKKLFFDRINDETSEIAQKFLYSAIQLRLAGYKNLWQPSWGGASFFDKNPDVNFRDSFKDIDVYRGFSVRPILLPGNNLGICLDVHYKYVSQRPLPTDIKRGDESRLKGMKCLYEYGDNWYEIRIGGLSDLKASEITVNERTLFDDVHMHASGEKSQLLRELPRDCSVLYYLNSAGDTRNVPSGLCRRTYGTNHPEIRRHHGETIKPPHIRRREIRFELDRYFRDITLNGILIKIAEPVCFDESRFRIPDLLFGCSKILSVRGSGTTNVRLEDFPKKKKEMFYSPEAGPFTKQQFDKQYLIMPKSIMDTFGQSIIADIKNEVSRLFNNDRQFVYDPILIAYDDVQHSVPRVSDAIMKALDEYKIDYGYGVVMIPEMRSRWSPKEDELANIIMNKARERDLFVSVIHTKIATDSFTLRRDGQSDEWELIDDRPILGKYRGYIQNVVLNKILLLNHLWPFILKTNLNADLVIGIDVKNNTAGFTVIHKQGDKFSFYDSVSEQREQLTREHVRSKINEIITNEQSKDKKTIKNIVIHRHGTLFPSEKRGVVDALALLKKQKAIDDNYVCTFVEVRTTSTVPYRLFSISNRMGQQGERVFNPFVGTYTPISSDEAFICTTGFPYQHRGTSHPLHIIKNGPMPLDRVLEDVFYLTNLTWTKIDDCSRLPITVKMADVRLREMAGYYDADALKFEGYEEE